MSDRFHHLFLACADFDASLAFYRDVLGWTPTSSRGEGGSQRAVALTGGGIEIVLSERPVSGTAAAPAASARFEVHLDIHDIDARFLEMPKGPHVVMEPGETAWGTRWFVVRDPDGNRIAFEELHRRGG
jgi:catechol 2,3-dioxygenase-like lactoylglutathione lyase family enzyme